MRSFRASNRCPPSFADFAAKPTSVWHDAQDAWLAEFSEGESTLPPAGKQGSIESKARAAAWKAAIKRHARVVRMSLAKAGDAAANATLDIDASRSSLRRHEQRCCNNGTAEDPSSGGVVVCDGDKIVL